MKTLYLFQKVVIHPVYNHKQVKTSVLNKWNQMHEAKNVFITDGSAMASSACQNPSLTYMALTARAADFAVSELKKGNL